MRHRPPVGNHAEVHAAGIGLDGDVQRQPVHHDGQMVERQHARAGQVQRHLGPGTLLMARLAIGSRSAKPDLP